MNGAVIGWIAIAALAFAGAGASVWGMRGQTSAASRILGMPATPPDATFLGGALTATVSATWPLARLELFDWGVRLRSSRRALTLLPLSVPTWEARYDELADVKTVTGLGTTGLRFAVSGQSDAVVFWTSNCPEILDLLATAGVTVDRSPMSLKQAGGLYRTW